MSGRKTGLIAVFIAFWLALVPVYGQGVNSQATPNQQNQQAVSDQNQSEQIPEDQLKKVILSYIIAGIDDVKTLDNLLYLFRLIREVEINYVDRKTSAELVELAMRGMISGLDPNSYLIFGDDELKLMKENFGKERRYKGGVGITIGIFNRNVFIIEVLDGTPAFKAGLEPGDVITKIDGKNVFGLNLDAVVNLIGGDEGMLVALEIRSPRFQKPKLISLRREKISVQSIFYKNIGRDVAYIQIKQFVEETPARFISALNQSRGKKSMILDLRGNLGGRFDIVVPMLEYLLGPGKDVLVIKGSEGIQSFHTSSFNRLRGPYFVYSEDFPRKIVVLVDNFSASASEIMAGALQYYKFATIIGVRTFGKATVQTILGINIASEIYDFNSANMILTVTTDRYFLPDNQNISANGIVPDIEVEQPDDFRLYERGTKRDLQLQEAIKLLRKK